MLNSIEIAILAGLRKSGRECTFTEILEEAGINADQSEKVQIATSLEELGLIKNVTYRLPLALRAELTLQGQDFVQSPEFPKQ